MLPEISLGDAQNLNNVIEQTAHDGVVILDKPFIWLVSLRFLDRIFHMIFISYKEGQGFWRKH